MIWRIFRRPSQPPPPPLVFPEFERDWAAGDKAECVEGDGTWFRIDTGSFRSNGPRVGQVFEVARVVADPSTVWLTFLGDLGNRYPAGHFRKLRPCSTDFREQLRNRAPSPPAKQPIRIPAPKAIPELVP